MQKASSFKIKQVSAYTSNEERMGVFTWQHSFRKFDDYSFISIASLQTNFFFSAAKSLSKSKKQFLKETNGIVFKNTYNSLLNVFFAYKFLHLQFKKLIHKRLKCGVLEVFAFRIIQYNLNGHLQVKPHQKQEITTTDAHLIGVRATECTHKAEACTGSAWVCS